MDSFTWRCKNEEGWSGIATCSVNVTTKPTALDKTYTVAMGSEQLLILSFNDPMGVYGDSSFTILTPPEHGELVSYYVVHPNATSTMLNHYMYYYPTPSYFGADSFTWKMNNGYSDSDPATASIVIMENQVPTINDMSITAGSGVPKNMNLTVTDPDGGQLRTYTLISPPSHGTLAMPEPTRGTGIAVYTAAPGYLGEDSFEWMVNDGYANSGVATVSITVDSMPPAPVYNYTETLPANQPSTFEPAITGGHGYNYTVVRTSKPSKGSIEASGKKFTYTPNNNFTGVDSFNWRVDYTDAEGVIQKSIARSCNLIIRDGVPARNGLEGAALNQSAVVIQNQNYSLSLFSGFALGASYVVAQEPVHGTVEIGILGDFTYTPNEDFTGLDSFT